MYYELSAKLYLFASILQELTSGQRAWQENISSAFLDDSCSMQVKTCTPGLTAWENFFNVAFSNKVLKATSTTLNVCLHVLEFTLNSQNSVS